MELRGRRYLIAVVSLMVAVAAAQPSPAQEGPGSRADGTRSNEVVRSSDPTLNNFEIVGNVRLGTKTKGDVFLYDHGDTTGKYAYVGSWSHPCDGRGVYIIDVTDPGNPKRVANARIGNDQVSFEDPVVARIGERDVLGVGVQDCGHGGRAGLALFDVTDPRNPQKLSFFNTPAHGVHELDMIARSDGTALAALAVPFGESDEGADIIVANITDPANPVEVSSWGIVADSTLRIPNITSPSSPTAEITNPLQGIGSFNAFYGHSVRFADDGFTLYASYWDAGIIKFDVTDPAVLTPLGETTYPFDADGDAHSMTPYNAGGKRYILQNDEDFDPLEPAHVFSSDLGGTRYASLEAQWLPKLLSKEGTIEAVLHDAGAGCDSSAYSNAPGRVVLIDTPIRRSIRECSLGRQVVFAAKAGAEALIVNFVGKRRAPAFPRMSANEFDMIQSKAKGLVGVATSSIDGLAETLRAAPASPTVTLEPQEPSWGFLRVFDESNPQDTDSDGLPEYQQVGEFTDLPHVQGDLSHRCFWSVHNTEVWGNRAFTSWYPHGIIAFDLSDPTNPALVGQFKTGERNSCQWGIWGVTVDQTDGLIYASDMISGLWIVRPTGDAIPTVP